MAARNVAFIVLLVALVAITTASASSSGNRVSKRFAAAAAGVDLKDALCSAKFQFNETWQPKLGGLPKCPGGFKDNEAGDACLSDCPTSHEPWNKDETQCISKCPPGQTPGGDVCKVAVPCPTNYKLDKPIEKCCLGCATNFMPSGTQCLEVCPKGFKIHNTTHCVNPSTRKFYTRKFSKRVCQDAFKTSLRNKRPRDTVLPSCAGDFKYIQATDVCVDDCNGYPGYSIDFNILLQEYECINNDCPDKFTRCNNHCIADFMLEGVSVWADERNSDLTEFCSVFEDVLDTLDCVKSCDLTDRRR